MKFNSILLIIFCLLQALNSSTDELNEQMFIDATSKILKYAKIYHQDLMNLDDREDLYDLKLYCPPLTLDNIQFNFEENGNLNIKFVNLKLSVTGKYTYGIGFSHIVNDFSAALNNFYWNVIYEVSKEELEDGKLDVKFKQVATSAFKYDVVVFNKKSVEVKDLNISVSVEDSLKEKLGNNLGFFTLGNQLLKVAALVLETVKSDLK